MQRKSTQWWEKWRTGSISIQRMKKKTLKYEQKKRRKRKINHKNEVSWKQTKERQRKWINRRHSSIIIIKTRWERKNETKRRNVCKRTFVSVAYRVFLLLSFLYDCLSVILCLSSHSSATAFQSDRTFCTYSVNRMQHWMISATNRQKIKKFLHSSLSCTFHDFLLNFCLASNRFLLVKFVLLIHLFCHYFNINVDQLEFN